MRQHWFLDNWWDIVTYQVSEIPMDLGEISFKVKVTVVKKTVSIKLRFPDDTSDSNQTSGFQVSANPINFGKNLFRVKDKVNKNFFFPKKGVL